MIGGSGHEYSFIQGETYFTASVNVNHLLAPEG